MNSERRESQHDARGESGRVGYVLLWLFGVPLPVVLILFLLFR